MKDNFDIFIVRKIYLSTMVFHRQFIAPQLIPREYERLYFLNEIF